MTRLIPARHIKCRPFKTLRRPQPIGPNEQDKLGLQQTRKAKVCTFSLLRSATKASADLLEAIVGEVHAEPPQTRAGQARKLVSNRLGETKRFAPEAKRVAMQEFQAST